MLKYFTTSNDVIRFGREIQCLKLNSMAQMKTDIINVMMDLNMVKGVMFLLKSLEVHQVEE